MTGDNKFLCSNYNKKTDTDKTLTISHTPTILILHLKRFTQFLHNKNMCDIDIPTQLTLPVSLFKTPHDTLTTYSLYAVSNHHSTTQHYTSYCNVKPNFPNPEWYLFDDLISKHVSTPQLAGANPYVLFYRKNN